MAYELRYLPGAWRDLAELPREVAARARRALERIADDLVGTLVEETITHAAGAKTERGMTRSAFEDMIRETGREPFERDSEYRRVVRNAA